MVMEASPYEEAYEYEGNVFSNVPLSTETSKKRRRSRSKLKLVDTAPTFDFEVMPRAVCLAPNITVGDLYLFTNTPGALTSVLSPTEWREGSQALRTYARRHPLYPVIIRGEHDRSKRCPQAALRRLEALLTWKERIFEDYSAEVANDIMKRQIAHGVSRASSRTWIPRRADRPRHTLPPKDLVGILMDCVWTVEHAAALGALRTLRVYDVTGTHVWLLPSSTLNTLMDCALPDEIAKKPETEVEMTKDDQNLPVMTLSTEPENI